jgi:shikimate dehydrogenase
MEKPKNNENKKPTAADELWFREEEKDLVAGRQITATVRAGDRGAETTDMKGGYKEGEYITLKILKADGSFDPLLSQAAVTDVEKKTFGDITPDDLEGTPLETKTKSELAKKLERLYRRAFTDEDIITIVRFEYADNLREAEDLVRAKILSFAREPKSNPGNMDFPKYTIPLIEHDYPARTALMWNAAYREFNLSYGNVMMVGGAHNAKNILAVLRADPKYSGGGAGVGFKDEVVPHLDDLEPLAKAVGAVNFILKTKEGKLKGYNTDGTGYAQSLEEMFGKRGEDIAGKKALLLGAGGTGNAIAFALAQKGMRIVIANRTVLKAQELAEKVNRFFDKTDANEMVRFGGEEIIAEEVKNADVVINVSTKGSAGALEKYSALASARLPVNEENIRENLHEAEAILRAIPQRTLISDIVLGKNATPFLSSAENAGFETLDGIPMVIGQGAEAFWLLHGEELAEKHITKEQVLAVMKRAARS